MPRKSKRSKNRGFTFKFILVAVLFLAVCLGSIWKTDLVKSNYRAMIDLEKAKKDIIAENTRMKADLQDRKSLSSIDNVVTKRFGLTQNVSSRLYLEDPVKRDNIPDPKYFVDIDKLVETAEDMMFGAGQANAKTNKKQLK
jgi:hypothetical protein